MLGSAAIQDAGDSPDQRERAGGTVTASAFSFEHLE
jgi:hypothetical protein